MSATPALPTPAHDDAQQREADTAYYRQVLHELIEIGTTLARTLAHQATQATAEPIPAQPQPAPATAGDLATAYERLTRAIRRTIALARTLDQPAPLLTTRGPAPRKPAQPLDLSKMSDAELLDGMDPLALAPALAPEHRRAAHEHITRAVEDAIRHEAREPSEAALLRAELAERLDDPGLDYDIEDRPIEEVIAEICRDLGLSDISTLRARAAQPPPDDASSPGQPSAPPSQTAPPRPLPTQTSTGPPAP